MTRLFSLSLVVVLASHAPLQAQPKDPPKYFTNRLGMKFVWIPPGTFTMGSPKEEKGHNEAEVQHKVQLTKGFYMSVYPVVRDQWQVMILSTGYIKPVEGFDLASPSRFQHDTKLPVDSVSWDDCQVFIKALQAMDKLPYRLPTEAEWEYACRAGTTTPFHCGKTLYSRTKKGQRQGTTPVGMFPANAWGLHDMHGNVEQWCQDRHGPLGPGAAVDPQGADVGGSRVLRGGSWEDNPARCRSACRAWDSPDNHGSGTFGLRVCFFKK